MIRSGEHALWDAQVRRLKRRPEPDLSAAVAAAEKFGASMRRFVTATRVTADEFARRMNQGR